MNVATNNPASQQVDKHFVAKGPEVNRFITQNKVNHHFITTQTHYKKVITSYKSTHVHKHVNHAKDSINKHFIVKPSESPTYISSQSLIIKHHFAVPGYHVNNRLHQGMLALKLITFVLCHK